MKLLAKDPIPYYYQDFIRRYDKRPGVREFMDYLRDYVLPKEVEQQLIAEGKEKKKSYFWLISAEAQNPDEIDFTFATFTPKKEDWGSETWDEI